MSQERGSVLQQDRENGRRGEGSGTAAIAAAAGATAAPATAPTPIFARRRTRSRSSPSSFPPLSSSVILAGAAAAAAPSPHSTSRTPAPVSPSIQSLGRHTQAITQPLCVCTYVSVYVAAAAAGHQRQPQQRGTRGERAEGTKLLPMHEGERVRAARRETETEPCCRPVPSIDFLMFASAPTDQGTASSWRGRERRNTD